MSGCVRYVREYFIEIYILASTPAWYLFGFQTGGLYQRYTSTRASTYSEQFFLAPRFKGQDIYL